VLCFSFSAAARVLENGMTRILTMPQFKEKSRRIQKSNSKVFLKLLSSAVLADKKFHGTTGQNKHVLAGAYPARKASIKVPK
jgi:hypothetical protein